MDGQNGGNEPVSSPNPEMGSAGMGNTSAGADIFSNDAATSSGAIFSNPDLTIEKDAIPDAISSGTMSNDLADVDQVVASSGISDGMNDASVDSNSARIATAFANTDASQGQALMSSNNSAVTQSTATGDIKLAPTPRKRNLKWLPIALGVIGVVAILGGVIALVMRGGGVSSTVSEAFSNYDVYLKNGPENINDDITDSSSTNVEDENYGTEEDGQNTQTDEAVDQAENDPDDEWFIFEDNPPISNEEYVEYLSEVKTRFENFTTKFEESEFKDSELARDLESYANALDFILEYRQLNGTRAEIEGVYQDDGRESALESIKKHLSGETLSDFMSSAYTAFEQYLISEVDLIDVYKKYGCLLDDGIDQGCVADLYDSENIDYIDKYDVHVVEAEGLNANYEAVKTYFQIKTNEFYESLGGSNV